MTMWFNFFFVVTGQLVLFGVLARIRGLQISKALRLALLSMLLGLPIGLVFDIFIGHYQSIFSYDGMPNTHVFFAMNGLFSYGLAIATVWLLPVPLAQHYSNGFRVGGLVLLGLAISTMISLISMTLPILLTMFAWGILMILCSEGLAALAGRTGPIMALAKQQPRPFFVLWAASISIGAFYEGLNWIFPLWRWHVSNSINYWSIEGLIISVGYVVLFQPMLVLSRLAIDDI
jgi:hypothetical protein